MTRTRGTSGNSVVRHAHAHVPRPRLLHTRSRRPPSDHRPVSHGQSRDRHPARAAPEDRRRAARRRVDAMLVPIGDNYTMGIEDAVRAVEFVQPRAVIPMHYNTWDVIKADPEQFKRQVGGRARVVVLAPGEAHTLS